MSRYSCIPDSEALESLRSDWSWRLPPDYELLLVTAFGDPFVERCDGVYWLNTGTADLQRVAADRAEFKQKLHSAEAADWLLPNLVDALDQEGKHREPGQCYTYAILPVFAEGKFETWNFKAVPARDHFGATAHIHRQIAELPDGAKVKISIQP